MNLPVASKTGSEVQAHFGDFTIFAQIDAREALADLDGAAYFAPAPTGA